MSERNPRVPDRYADKSREELLERIAELEKRKKYGLVWEYDPEDVVVQCQNSLPVLREVSTKEIVTDSSLPMNLLIEGDNYHSLSVLNYTHKERIDVIYIDPPYNTGSDNWKYNDKIVNKDDGYRHSKWISMMEKRLYLAKNLLSSEGVIFISIDDNEQANLKLLMDEIFGGENFVTTFHVQMSTTQGMKVAAAQKGTIVKNAEYVLCYCRNKDSLYPFNLLHEAKDWDNHYQIYYNENTKERRTLKEFIEDAQKEGLIKKSSQNDIAKKYADEIEFRDFINKNSHSIFRDAMCEKNFSFSSEQEKSLKNKEIVSYTDIRNKSYLVFLNSNNNKQQLLSLDMAIGNTDDFTPTYGLRKIRGNWWKDYYKDMMNIAKEGGMEFKNGKKPVRLLKDLMKLVKNKEATVLDFFAGSGSTGHAVLKLNKEDGGLRKFILCTNNENQIAENITYPRISNVINGYRKNIKSEEPSLGGNLKYYKTSLVLGGSSDPAKHILSEKAVEMLCVRESTFEGVETNNEEYKIYRNNKQHTVIILNKSAIANCKKKITNIDSPFVIYLFSLSDKPDTDEFTEFGERVQVKPIPEPILQIYRHIFK